MNKVVVVDLDGTLANVDHRLHLIKSDKPDWDGFFAACGGDTPNQWCVALIASIINFGHTVVVVSARSKVCAEETQVWIDRHLPAGVGVILLREVGDTTPDVELKKRWLDSITWKDEILFVVDDRQRVVDMWRANGLVCLQCNSWEEWKPTKKEHA